MALDQLLQQQSNNLEQVEEKKIILLRFKIKNIPPIIKKIKQELQKTLSIAVAQKMEAENKFNAVSRQNYESSMLLA